MTTKKQLKWELRDLLRSYDALSEKHYQLVPRPSLFKWQLTPEHRAMLDEWSKQERDHPWSNPFRGIGGVVKRELVYTRRLRIRWHSEPLKWDPVWVRAWFGRLEIVYDPIKKETWVKRDKSIKRQIVRK